ncbi:MAG TPA: TonB family protein, partial [Brevundimonas sp.]|nr:TonB family protein [Brevundimonas sp.]
VAVTLECTARADGRVDGCRVLGETHPGMGFGEAAIALMRDARVDPGQRDVQFARTIQFTP